MYTHTAGGPPPVNTCKQCRTCTYMHKYTHTHIHTHTAGGIPPANTCKQCRTVLSPEMRFCVQVSFIYVCMCVYIYTHI